MREALQSQGRLQGERHMKIGKLGKLQQHMIIASGAIFLLSGCAKKPESIAASYVSANTYQDFTCKQLAE